MVRLDVAIARAALVAAGVAALSSAAHAQAGNRGLTVVPADKAKVTGSMTITFNSRNERSSSGLDTYSLKELTIADLMVLRGEINRVPDEKMSYSTKIDLINPANPTQVAKEVAILRGDMAIDDSGRYQPTSGELRLDVVKGTLSSAKFGGSIQGREVTRWWEFRERYKSAKAEATKLYSRYVDGKTITIQVKNPDPLGFQNLVLPAGPLSYLPETKVNGDFDYDYELGNWLTDNAGITMSYNLGDKPVVDKITGSIRYVEEEGSATDVNGKKIDYTGYYEYNLRWNEDQAKNDAAFFDGENSQGELDAFFSASDTSKPGLYGRVYYKDSEDDCKKVEGEDGKQACVGPTVSEVSYDLKPVGLTYAQLAAWFKLEQMVIGPFSDD